MLFSTELIKYQVSINFVLKNIEIETSFLVHSFDIDEILKIIKKTGDMYNFLLTELKEQFFGDFYFDNMHFDLAKKKMALRLRFFDDKTAKIALKQLKKEDAVFSERLELEDIFSEKFSKLIFNFLLSNDIQINIENLQNIYFNHLDDPKSFLKCMGFDIIQRRITSRKILNYHKNHEILYEFAIDKTSFLLPNREISFLSVELESKSLKNHKNDYMEIILTLLRNSNNVFKVWNFNKLMTGFAIEHLFKNGHLTDKNLNEKSFLNNNSISILENYLNSSDKTNNCF